jgi:hypothetical protein
MKSYKSNGIRQDRRPLDCSAKNLAGKPRVIVGSSLGRWFRSLELALGKAGFDLVVSLLLTRWHRRPVLVIAHTMYPTSRPQNPRGHVRI